MYLKIKEAQNDVINQEIIKEDMKSEISIKNIELANKD